MPDVCTRTKPVAVVEESNTAENSKSPGAYENPASAMGQGFVIFVSVLTSHVHPVG